MELFKLIFIGIAYLCLTLYCGRYLIKFLKIKFESEIINILLGFLIIEAASFICFVLFGILGLIFFLFSFIPNILLIFVIFFRKIFYKDSLQVNFRNFKYLLVPCLFLFICITFTFLAGSWNQFISVLNFEGVIYHDIIYHGGIVNSIINFGYPVRDPQFYDQVLNYHLFTHFLTAKISYITGANPFLSYFFFLNIIGILLYSILSIAVSNFLLRHTRIENKIFPISVFTLSFIAFFCSFFFGGSLNASFVFGFFFSSSFQWQLFLLLIFYFVVMEVVHFENYSKRNMAILLLLFFVACITKVSSLPLMIAGILSLCIFYVLFFNKSFLKYWSILGVLYIFFGILIYYMFFSGNKSDGSMIEFNLDIIEIVPIVAYFRLTEPLVLLIIFFITTASYRFLLFFELKNFNTWFSGAILLTGFILSLLFKHDQLYFLFPSIIISSHLSLSLLWNTSKRKYLIFLAISLIILSFYPIAHFGLTISNKLKSENHYYPINYNRMKLFEWLNYNTDKNEVIFTTSVIGSPENTADNFYPAAISKRIFFLGGYRFGGVENFEDFGERINLVKHFDINSKSIHNSLRAENVSFILIEKKGNFNDDLYYRANNMSSNNLYELVYKNEMGLILRLK
ncbi:hypothetical protein [Gillisia sp. JM1]|uniref:hypothetical protein n=1 Tax=Gillisia sp. JM1 TaxID=1283286 RepID=UPI000421D805|nr:hypothetical protein [Gillisia sp. JM1]